MGINRTIIETSTFTKEVNSLIRKQRISSEDWTDFKKKLAENPEQGDVIQSTGGLRKTRLKSISRGKSGGFRVCYYYYSTNEEIYLLCIYSKNKQEDLSYDEKRSLKQLVDIIKRKSE